MPRDNGTSVVDMLLVLALMTTAASMGVPLVGESRDADRLRRACQWLAGEVRGARQATIQSGRRGTIQFTRLGDADFLLQRCPDDGRCVDAAAPLSAWFPGVRIHRDTSIPDPSGSQTTAAVTFGGGVVAFTAGGTGSSGTVIIRSPRGRHCAVRVAGVTGRVRTLTFDVVTRQWRP